VIKAKVTFNSIQDQHFAVVIGKTSDVELSILSKINTRLILH